MFLLWKKTNPFYIQRLFENGFYGDLRFAGEEPKDVFTKHYNQEMAHILPKYNIKFCEIPRRKCNGQVISATNVRKYIKQKRWDEVQKLVLPQIYEYLYNNYK